MSGAMGICASDLLGEVVGGVQTTHDHLVVLRASHAELLAHVNSDSAVTPVYAPPLSTVYVLVLVLGCEIQAYAASHALRVCFLG